jgi:hypothetical protein
MTLQRAKRKEVALCAERPADDLAAFSDDSTGAGTLWSTPSRGQTSAQPTDDEKPTRLHTGDRLDYRVGLSACGSTQRDSDAAAVVRSWSSLKSA